MERAASAAVTRGELLKASGVLYVDGIGAG